MPGVRVLTYLLAIAEFGHFGRAAERCNVSQSTLSGQLKRFEDYLGVRLIERHPDGARLTDAGRRVVPWADVMVHAAKRLRDTARTPECT
ncbi:MAG: LysR family transcriptional regulator [Gammaproteobacteria bacterium]|nr:LysR family transcriptional regulator [Gammaproteobacteria bacterium]MCP5137729.1 LysR family transcriptional regulator [Gammaproteobacteria bacterium]